LAPDLLLHRVLHEHVDLRVGLSQAGVDGVDKIDVAGEEDGHRRQRRQEVVAAELHLVVDEAAIEQLQSVLLNFFCPQF
jgi:hypothetical protein